MYKISNHKKSIKVVCLHNIAEHGKGEVDQVGGIPHRKTSQDLTEN